MRGAAFEGLQVGKRPWWNTSPYAQAKDHFPWGKTCPGIDSAEHQDMSMKLYTTDNSELMEVYKIYPENGNLMVEGTIMGAMPVRAVVKPGEVRRALCLMSFKTLLFAFFMLFRGSR
jgi:hypothetical protein